LEPPPPLPQLETIVADMAAITIINNMIERYRFTNGRKLPIDPPRAHAHES
jgi:hypothetical protein